MFARRFDLTGQELIESVELGLHLIVVVLFARDKCVSLIFDPDVDSLLLFLETVHLLIVKLLVQRVDGLLEVGQTCALVDLRGDLLFNIFYLLL